jgi:hypothetical protein
MECGEVAVQILGEVEKGPGRGVGIGMASGSLEGKSVGLSQGVMMEPWGETKRWSVGIEEVKESGMELMDQELSDEEEKRVWYKFAIEGGAWESWKVKGSLKGRC